MPRKPRFFVAGFATHVAIDHMNDDHVDAMQLILKHFKGVIADQVKLTHLYPDGCVFKLNEEKSYYVPYVSLAIEEKDIRTELVKLTQQARANKNNP